MFRICPHCEKNLGVKAYKEHKRHYFSDGQWTKEDTLRPHVVEQSPSTSTVSSSMNLPLDPCMPPLKRSKDEIFESSSCGNLSIGSVNEDDDSSGEQFGEIIDGG